MFSKSLLNKTVGAFSLLAAVSTLPATAEEQNLSSIRHAAEFSRYQFGIVNSYVSVRGRFDPYGDYNENPEGSSVWLSTTILTSSYSFTPRLEGSLGLAAVHVAVTSPGSNASVWVLGSPSLGLHYEVWEPLRLTVRAGGTLPWKARFAQVDGLSSREVSGFEGMGGDSGGSGGGAGGAASLNFGLGMSRSFHPVRLSLDAGILLPFAADLELSDAPPGTPTVRIKKGMKFNTSEKLGYLLSRTWGISGGFKQVWGLETEMDGANISGTANRKFSTTLGVSYVPNVNWRWSAGFETQFPFYAYIVNQPYSPTMTVSAMYSGF